MIKVFVAGLSGRVGKLLAPIIRAEQDLELTLELAQSSLVIDFSSPSHTLEVARECSLHKIPLVIGTTGFTDEQLALLRTLSTSTKIFLSYNMSVGIAALTSVLPRLNELMPGFNVSITETHHKHKVDKPSGTAITLSDTLSGCNIHSIRDGEHLGEHEILFTAVDEQLKINHTALSREVFAKNAVKIGKWLVNLEALNGYYNMSNYLKHANS